MKVNKPIRTKEESFNYISQLNEDRNITQKELDKHNKRFNETWIVTDGYLCEVRILFSYL